MSTPTTLKSMWLPALAALLGLFQIVAATEISDPTLENAIALTVFAGLGLTALLGVGLRRRRRTTSDILIMLGVLQQPELIPAAGASANSVAAARESARRGTAGQRRRPAWNIAVGCSDTRSGQPRHCRRWVEPGGAGDPIDGR